MDKLTISRSYSRKINLGNYEVADFFSSRSQEIDEGAPLEEQIKISHELHALCIAEVEREIEKYLEEKRFAGELGEGVPFKKLIEAVNSISSGRPMMITDWEKCSPAQQELLQAVKRAYKRSPEYKSKQIPRK